MKTKTIQQLNTINTDFYASIATEFSNSRNYPWEGWRKCIPYIAKSNSTFSVADIGCGNGRFGLFLADTLDHSFSYTGIDNNPELLSITQKTLANTEKIASLTTQSIDLVASLIDNSLEKKLSDTKYSLITVFGVMHHIPSLRLRSKLVKTLAKNLKKNGILILTYWQFMKDERFLYKQVPAKNLNIIEEELEDGDYLLDWKRGKLAYRYFHNSSIKEQKEIAQISPETIAIDTFLSDGKTQDLNSYWILQKQ